MSKKLESVKINENTTHVLIKDYEFTKVWAEVCVDAQGTSVVLHKDGEIGNPEYRATITLHVNEIKSLLDAIEA